MPLHREIIVDNFAGGGGASTGITLAIGRSADIAINHDPAAIAMYKANHSGTEIHCESVWGIDPVKACKGRPVALAWFSPDCKHFSKAKGGEPVEKKIRGLAWIVLKWAGKVRPRVIMLENVEEFVTWGPVRKGKPVKSKKGQTFEMWKSQLISLGYKVEHRELKACDYGAPTSRKRFFLIARCDGKPIVWPKPTHGDPKKIESGCGLMKPWRTAAECIDWSLPCPSIFDRKKPLAENTLYRIARGMKKFVFENPQPFIAQIGQTGFTKDRSHSINTPLSTIVTKQEHMLITPFLSQYHGEKSSPDTRGQVLDSPILTLDGSNRYSLVAVFLSKYYAGNYTGDGVDLNEPTHTITSRDHHALVTSHLLQMNNHCDGRSMNEPIPTIVAGPGHWGEVRTFLMSYYGSEKDLGQTVDEPLRTITGTDRFGIVTVYGQDYMIVDIGMRMLEPRELYDAQGFPHDYIINFKNHQGRPYPKKSQVARCGNSVPPPFSEALVRSNLPELCTINLEDKNLQYLLS